MNGCGALCFRFRVLFDEKRADQMLGLPVFDCSFSENKPPSEVVERKALAIRPPCVKGAVALATEGLFGA